MTKNVEFFFNLLSSALWDKEPGDLAGIDWNEVLKIADQQSVVPLIADVVLKNCCQGLTTVQADNLQKRIYGSINTHMKLNSVLFKVEEHLMAGGVYPVLLKGQGIASFYREPFLRQCGDIDLYIGEEDYEKAVELSMQIVDKDADHEYSESDKHYHLKVGGVVVEIHRISARMADPKYSATYSEYESKYLKTGTDSVKINERDVVIPEITFNLLFTFYHAWYHFMSGGLGIRQICDISVYLDANFYRIDKERFHEMLVSLDLLEPWQMFMDISVSCLGLDKEKALFHEEVNQKRLESMLKFILTEGNFGHHRKESFFIPSNAHWFFRKIRSLSLSSKRYHLLKTVSPKYAHIFYRHYLNNGFKALIHDPK